VDGAGGLDVLRYITLPLLSRFIILATTFRIMDSLRIFDVIYATTVGGPCGCQMNLHMRAFFYVSMVPDGMAWLRHGPPGAGLHRQLRPHALLASRRGADGTMSEAVRRPPSPSSALHDFLRVPC